MKKLLVIALAVVAVAGCTPKPATPPAQANAMTPMPFGPPPAATNGATPAVQAAAECASYGLKAGTADYNSCVAGMTKADEAVAGDTGDNDEAPANAVQMRADMKADMDRDRAEDERDMRDAQHPADGSASHCVTTRHGSNVSTVCP